MATSMMGASTRGAIADLLEQARSSRPVGAVVAGLRWFTAFRRTRPFWGGLWALLAGVWIIRSMFFDFVLAATGGWSYSAGYILGGALVLFGLVAWFAPLYRSLVGVLAVLISLAAFVGANLGGYVLGSVLGIIGGSMIWAWGEKPARRRRRTRRDPAS